MEADTYLSLDKGTNIKRHHCHFYECKNYYIEDSVCNDTGHDNSKQNRNEDEDQKKKDDDWPDDDVLLLQVCNGYKKRVGSPAAKLPSINNRKKRERCEEKHDGQRLLSRSIRINPKRPLPISHQQLLTGFDRINSLYAFMTSRNMDFTCAAVEKMLPADCSVGLQNMKTLAFIAPEIMTLEEVATRGSAGGHTPYSTAPITPPSIALTIKFHRFAGKGKNAATSRRKAIHQALLRHVDIQHEAFCSSLRDNSARLVSKSGPTWHPGFDLERVQPITLPECRKIKEKSLHLELRNHVSNTFTTAATPLSRKDSKKELRPASYSPSLTGACHFDPSSVPLGSTIDPFEVIKALKSLPFYKNQICHVEKIGARSAKTAPLLPPLPEELNKALQSIKVDVNRLFTHQVQAISAFRNGKDVCISTSTSSGKSLSYQIPILETLLENPDSVAIMLFPTKALAVDQLRSLSSILAGGPHLSSIGAFTWNGDTEKEERKIIRETGQIFLTNPDMLHVSCLPHHKMWRRIFSNLKVVIVDEAHAYKGGFGAHVACVLRRLRRICELYESRPKFIFCTATIGNPLQHFTCLTGLSESQCELVSRDGSPCGERHFVVWNPSLIVPKQNADVSLTQISSCTCSHFKISMLTNKSKTTQAKEQGPTISALGEYTKSEASRESSIFDAAQIMSALLKLNVKSLTFCKVRKVVELVLMYLKSDLAKSAPELLPYVYSYRGGYTKKDRQEIEKKMFTGNILGAVATNALELGIDIGSLDATVLLGYPNSISSLWQQAGRAGRSGRKALTILVLFNSPVDQFFARHAHKMLNRKPERTICNPYNQCVLKTHLVCAAKEFPLESNKDGPRGDCSLFCGLGKNAQSIYIHLISELKATGMIIPADREGNMLTYHPLYENYAIKKSLRVIDSLSYCVLHKDRELDSCPISRAFFEIYVGAVYLNQGREYLITHIDHKSRSASATIFKSNYFTSCRDHTDVNVKQQYITRGASSFGPVTVSTQVWGYFKIWKRTGKIFESVDLDLPEVNYDTFGAWIDIDTCVKRNIENNGHDFAAALHAAAHLLLSAVPLVLPVDDKDIHTECVNAYQERSRPLRLVIYDTRPGGLNICRRVFDILPTVVARAINIVEECSCSSGCLACVHNQNCSEYNFRCCKSQAREVLLSIISCLNDCSKNIVGVL